MTPSARLRASQAAYKAACAVVDERDQGVCLRCGGRASQHHHRYPRRMGGSSRNPLIHRVSNLVSLCTDCHAWAESERNQAVQCGWLLMRVEVSEIEPVVIRPGTLLFLSDDGSKRMIWTA